MTSLTIIFPSSNFTRQKKLRGVRRTYGGERRGGDNTTSTPGTYTSGTNITKKVEEIKRSRKKSQKRNLSILKKLVLIVKYIEHIEDH